MQPVLVSDTMTVSNALKETDSEATITRGAPSVGLPEQCGASQMTALRSCSLSTSPQTRQQAGVDKPSR